MKPGSEICFGVEIECYLPVEVAERDGSHLGNGLQINWAPSGWGGKRDGSLTSRYPGYTAVEVVSPILCGEDGITQVYYMIDTIKSLHGKVDDTCGLHIHVDARTMTREQVALVKTAFVRYENAFYGLNGPKTPARLASCYCKNSRNWGTDAGDRYRSLNLTNYFASYSGKKTVEIRLWAGTLDVATVVAAAYMAVSLVAKVLAGQAETGEQITGFEPAMRAFCRSHLYSRQDGFRIVPGVSVGDITVTMFKAARQADRACRRAARTGR